MEASLGVLLCAGPDADMVARRFEELGPNAVPICLSFRMASGPLNCEHLKALMSPTVKTRAIPYRKSRFTAFREIIEMNKISHIAVCGRHGGLDFGADQLYKTHLRRIQATNPSLVTYDPSWSRFIRMATPTQLERTLAMLSLLEDLKVVPIRISDQLIGCTLLRYEHFGPAPPSNIEELFSEASSYLNRFQGQQSCYFVGKKFGHDPHGALAGLASGAQKLCSGDRYFFYRSVPLLRGTIQPVVGPKHVEIAKELGYRCLIVESDRVLTVDHEALPRLCGTTLTIVGAG
jgi:hypothetical protein